MTAPQRTYLNNSGARNGNIRGCMPSYLSGPLSNAMLYQLVLKSEARLFQYISHLSTRLDASMLEIRSLVNSALHPTHQHDNTSRGGLRGNEELNQETHAVNRNSRSSPQMVGYENANNMMNVVVKKEPHYCTRKCASNTGETRWECECGYNTNRKRYMNHHTKAKGLARFRCPLCPGLFPSCTNVRKHLVKDHKLRHIPTRLLRCHRCYQVFLKTEDKDGHKTERNKICMSRRDRLNKLRNKIDVITLSE